MLVLRTPAFHSWGDELSGLRFQAHVSTPVPRFLDQFALDLKSQRARQPPGGPIPCTTADVCTSEPGPGLRAQKRPVFSVRCCHTSRSRWSMRTRPPANALNMYCREASFCS